MQNISFVGYGIQVLKNTDFKRIQSAHRKTILKISKFEIKRTIHMENILKRLGNLLSVKSLVTLALTIVFGIQTFRGMISQDFMTIYAVIIAFYFGTQSQKVQDAMDGGGANE